MGYQYTLRELAIATMTSGTVIKKNTVTGKLKLYASFKEHTGFENYLNEPNTKIRQAITKIRISAHKFPIEVGRFENKNQTDRICPLCCDGIGNELHYLIECKNKVITNSPYHKPVSAVASKRRFSHPGPSKMEDLPKQEDKIYIKKQ